MDSHIRTKLNQLLTSWPRGTVASSTWLAELKISRQHVDQYRKSRWVYSVGRGAVARTGEKVAWTGGLYAIQKQLGLRIHVGARTALNLLGHAHYLRLGSEVVFLFGSASTKLPTWFKKYEWGNRIHFVSTNLFPAELQLGFLEKEQGDFTIQIATPERAILEALYLIPQHQGFDEVQKIFDSLTTLRPDVLQTLLQRCTSIKVKRLFFYFAEKSNYSWFKKLDPSKIDLGKGKRVIVTNGKLDKKYLITVPKEDFENEQGIFP